MKSRPIVKCHWAVCIGSVRFGSDRIEKEQAASPPTSEDQKPNTPDEVQLTRRFKALWMTELPGEAIPRRLLAELFFGCQRCVYSPRWAIRYAKEHGTRKGPVAFLLSLIHI